MPGAESRPDRILISKPLHSLSASLTGNGSVYRAKFFIHIVWRRGENMLWAAYDSFRGETGRSCIYDCGPHASCRCGVCVSGGDQRTCHLPDCDECNISTFRTLVLVAIVFFLLGAQLLYGMLLVFLTMNERAARRDTTKLWCGNCCLCDPALYVSMSRGIKRRTRQSILWKVWPFCRLPPMVLVLVTFGMIFVFTELLLIAFKELVDDMYAILPEEFFPSDHLLLSVELTMPKSSHT